MCEGRGAVWWWEHRLLSLTDPVLSFPIPFYWPEDDLGQVTSPHWVSFFLSGNSETHLSVEWRRLNGSNGACNFWRFPLPTWEVSQDSGDQRRAQDFCQGWGNASVPAAFSPCASCGHPTLHGQDRPGPSVCAQHLPGAGRRHSSWFKQMVVEIIRKRTWVLAFLFFLQTGLSKRTAIIKNIETK